MLAFKTEKQAFFLYIISEQWKKKESVFLACKTKCGYRIYLGFGWRKASLPAIRCGGLSAIFTTCTGYVYSCKVKANGQGIFHVQRERERDECTINNRRMLLCWSIFTESGSYLLNLSHRGLVVNLVDMLFTRIYSCSTGREAKRIDAYNSPAIIRWL